MNTLILFFTDAERLVRGKEWTAWLRNELASRHGSDSTLCCLVKSTGKDCAQGAAEVTDCVGTVTTWGGKTVGAQLGAHWVWGQEIEVCLAPAARWQGLG